MLHRSVVLLLVLGVLGASAWLLRLLLPEWPLNSDTIVNIVGVAAFLVALEFFQVRVSSGHSWVPTLSVDIAAWILFGPVAVMTIELIAVVVGDGFVRRRPVLRVLFNAGSTALAAGLAGLVYHSLPWSDRLTSPLFFLPALLSQAVFILCNTGLLILVVSLSERRHFVEVLRSIVGWHHVTGLSAAPLSAFLVFSFSFAGLWSLILFGIPVWIVSQTHRLFEGMKQAHKEVVAALTTALEADEPYTHGHSHRVANYAIQIGRRLNLSPRELETLEYAGLLHDIGKIAITNDIVCKPARLSKDEFAILSVHPSIGGEIVEKMDFLKEATDLVRHHHERPDGQGYPDGLRGGQISLGSHILNLADAIDAMCSNRPYRVAMTLEQCVAEVRRFRGSQFDDRVVDVFVKLVEQGTFQLVQQNDETAREIQRIVREDAKKREEERRKREAELAA